MRQRDAPKGSSMTPYNPSEAICEEAPKTVSEPNQVANKAATDMYIGSFPPARIKSLPVFTLKEAHKPIPKVANKYDIMM